MKTLMVCCVVGCLMVGSPVRGQSGLGSDKARNVSSVMASAHRAAERLELQVNSAPQRQRRKGRLYGGLIMLGVGIGAIFAGGAAAGNDGIGPRYGKKGTATGLVVAAGLGLAIGGGVLIARADTASSVRTQEAKRNKGLFERHMVTPSPSLRSTSAHSGAR